MRKVLKASAGTGKTYRLSLEYIAALINGNNFTDIIVMTFTKKATAEICERILNFLDIIVNGVNSTEKQELIDNLNKNCYIEDINIDNLRNKYIEILQNKDSFEIYTIDAFTNKIFKKIVMPNRKIFSQENDESDEIYEKVLIEIIEKKQVFKNFRSFFTDRKERDVENYIDFIKDIIKNRWKYFLITKSRDKLNEKSKKSQGDYFKKLEDLIIKIYDFADTNGKNREMIFNKVIKDYLSLKTIEEKLEYLQDNKMKFLDNNIWNGNLVKAKKDLQFKEEFVEYMQEIHYDIAADIYNKEILKFEKTYFELGTVIFEIYDKIRFRERKFSFSDITFYTLETLIENEYIVDNKLSEQFFDEYESRPNTIFLDEFQDTSIFQWKILHSFVETLENSIIVGDEKQSIYGWRDGEKRLFEKLPNIIDAEVKNLNRSFRSRENLLDLINDYFGLIEGWNYSKVDGIKKDGFVDIVARQNSDETIAEFVQLIKNSGDSNNVGVIARKNKHLLNIATEMEKEGIPYILESNQTIIDYKSIKGLYFLLEYLCYEDYFSLLKFLRADINSIYSNDFTSVLQKREEIEKYMGGLIEEIEICDCIKLILDKLKYLKDLDYLKQINYIFSEFASLNIFESESERKNIFYLYTLISRFNGISEFLNWIDENMDNNVIKRLSANQDNAIRLMSIHKSKGLEFETEYFYWTANEKPPISRGIQFYVKYSNDFEKILDYQVIESKYLKILPYLDIDFKEAQDKKEEEEEINNLYVAITRAKSNLICYYVDCARSKKYSDQRKSSSRTRIDEALSNYIPYSTISELEETGCKTGCYIFENIVANGGSKKIDSSLRERLIKSSEIIPQEKIELSTEYKRKEGLALHYYFENICYNESSEKDYAKNMVLKKYGNMIGKNVYNIIERAENHINENIEIFSKKWAVYNEFEIKDFTGSVKRIDRLMINKENRKILIVDFKDSKDATKSIIYQHQIDNYCKIAKKYFKDYEITGIISEIR